MGQKYVNIWTLFDIDDVFTRLCREPADNPTGKIINHLRWERGFVLKPTDIHFRKQNLTRTMHIQTHHRTHSFGEMINLQWAKNKQAQFMRFTQSGKPHAHPTDEIAILVSGSGWTRVGAQDIYTDTPGQQVRIPAKTSHYMIPETDMTMLIIYPEGKDVTECELR